jgi:hypothetical protein
MLKLIFSIILIVSILNNNIQTKIIKHSNKYHLKWIYNDYVFPIYMSQKLDNTGTTLIDADYKWFRLTDQIYVDNLDNHEKYFVQDVSRQDELTLHILDYNYATHDQLASYQPKMIAIRSDNNNNNNNAIDEEEEEFDLIKYEFNEKKSDIFTLAYLKSQEILIDDVTNAKKIDYSCSVTVLLPLMDNQSSLINEYNKLLQDFIYIKMVLASNDENADFLNLNKKYFKNKKRRSVKQRRQVNNNNNMDDKVVNLLEIEIREGPISVFKQTNRKDNISCLVRLTDSDSSNIKYEKTIFKIFNKMKSPSYFTSSSSSTSKSTQQIQNKKPISNISINISNFNYFYYFSLFNLIIILLNKLF